MARIAPIATGDTASCHAITFRSELNAAALSYGWGLPIFVTAAAPRTETVERRAVEQIRLEQGWRPSPKQNLSSAASGLSIIPACAVAVVAQPVVGPPLFMIMAALPNREPREEHPEKGTWSFGYR